MKLVVRAGDLSGQRDLESTTCESLANAAAVHVALLLNGRDPGQVGEAATAPPRAPSRAATPRSQRDGEVGNARGAASGDAPTNPASNAPGNASNTAPANPTSSADTDPARDAADPASRGDRDSDPGVRLLLQVPRASAQLGPLPRASFGVSVAGGLMLRDWRLIAAAHVWLRQALSRDDQPTIRADVDRVSASLRLCRAATWKRFEVAPCAKVSLEHVWARGAGDDVTARTAEATWLAAGLGLQSRLYLLTWWSVVAELDLEFEAARPEISIDGFGRVGKLGLTAFTLTLGSEWIL